MQESNRIWFSSHAFHGAIVNGERSQRKLFFLMLFMGPMSFFCKSLPVWPGRIVLSLSLRNTSRLALWTRSRTAASCRRQS